MVAEYTLLDKDNFKVENYSIADIMDFYLVDSDSVVTIFLNLDEIFTSEDDQYHTITRSDVLRPDLISFKYYGNVNYIWIIFLANDILDPFSLEIGQILRIPSRMIILNKWIK